MDWGLLVFFVGLFTIVGGVENCGLTIHLVEITERFNLHNGAVLTAITAALSNVVSNVPAVMLLKTLIPAFPDPHTSWLVLAMADVIFQDWNDGYFVPYLRRVFAWGGFRGWERHRNPPTRLIQELTHGLLPL